MIQWIAISLSGESCVLTPLWPRTAEESLDSMQGYKLYLEKNIEPTACIVEVDGEARVFSWEAVRAKVEVVGDL